MKFVLYICDNCVSFLWDPFKGENSKVSKKIMLFVKGVAPESKAEDINGNTYK